MNFDQRGLTLVEMTVAATIFSIVMLATVTAFRTFALSHEKLKHMTASTSEMREVDRFLRETLRSAIAYGEHFDGGGREVRWVAPLDRVGSAGGLQHLRLRQSSDTLVLSFAPVEFDESGDAEPRWGAAVADYNLLESVSRVSFSYRASPGDDWRASSDSSVDDDQVSRKLPSSIKLAIQTEQAAWPEIVVLLDEHEAGL